MKKIYWIIGSGIVLVVLLIIYKISSGSQPTLVTLDKVVRRDIIETVSATGKIQPETELKITSDVSGEITEMLVKEGDEIKKGDLICRIQPDMYQSAVERVTATLNTTKANLKTAEAQLEQAKANLVNAEANFKRSKKLLEQNAISQQEFETSKAQYESAKANVEGLEASVNASKFNILSSEAALKEAAANLEKTYIYSPVNGTVYKMNVEKGERVQGVQGFQGTEILRLANLNEMEVSVEVNENDIIKVHKGDTAIVEVDAYINKKFKGIVTEVANSANTTGVSIDQVTNFIVKIRLLRESYAYLVTERNPVPFRPGMSASVEIQTLRVSKALAVPIQAVASRIKDSTGVKGKEYKEGEETKNKGIAETKELVFMVENGKAKEIEVKSGIQDDEYIEIISGLKEGEEIIVAPYSAVSRTLKNGSKVKVVPRSELYRLN